MVLLKGTGLLYTCHSSLTQHSIHYIFAINRFDSINLSKVAYSSKINRGYDYETGVNDVKDLDGKEEGDVISEPGFVFFLPVVGHWQAYHAQTKISSSSSE